MNALEKRCLKGKLIDKLETDGIKAEATDSAELVFFTDKPINKTSKKIGNYSHSFLTSFGVKAALKFMEAAK